MSPVAEREGGEKGGREGGKEGKEHSPHLHLGPIPEKEDHVARGAEGPEDVIYALDVCVDDLRGEGLVSVWWRRRKVKAWEHA